MTFEIDVDGTTRQVSVQPIGAAGPAGGRFRVTVDGETTEVDARATDVGLSFLTGRGRVVDAALASRSRGEWLVQLPHVSLVATVDGRRLRRGGAADAAGSGEQRITAPMPGRVVRVLVQPGDEVAARQGVVVMEAMKMENELTARRPGRVREVAVAEGVSVESGRLLVVIE